MDSNPVMLAAQHLQGHTHARAVSEAYSNGVNAVSSLSAILNAAHFISRDQAGEPMHPRVKLLILHRLLEQGQVRADDLVSWLESDRDEWKAKAAVAGKVPK